MDSAVIRFKNRRKRRLEKGAAECYDSVEEYKKRRKKRIADRLDEEPDAWITVNGSPVPLKDGKAIGGVLKGKDLSDGPPVKRSGNDKGGREADGKRYSGKPMEVESGIGGALKPKSDGARKIDTRDAMEEVELYKKSGGERGLAKNSLSGYVNEDGSLKPSRQKVHDEIVQRVFEKLKSYDGKATMTMSGGGPASGKSFVSSDAKGKFGEDTVLVVDPDEIKQMLPGYTDMAVAGDKAAGFYHEESSALAKRIYQYALDNNINVVYDGTGDGSLSSVQKKITAARNAGYTVNGEYVTVDTEEAVKRNRQRYEKAKEKYEKGLSDIPPRLPNEQLVRDTHAKVADIQFRVAPLFDNFVLYDNNGSKEDGHPIIATCKLGGEVEIVPGMHERVQRALGKGKLGGKVYRGKVTFPDR